MYEKQLIAQNKSHTQVPTHRNGGNKMEFMIMRDYTAQKSRDYMSLVTWVGIPRWGSLSKRALPGYTQVGVVFLDEPRLNTITVSHDYNISRGIVT